MRRTEPWYGYDIASRIMALHWFAACWSSLLQREMGPIIVIIAGVVTHQPLQMMFVQHDSMIEQISCKLPTQRSATLFCHGLRKLIRMGWMPKLFAVHKTSSLKFPARSKIR
jgi:hypothetical protein